MFTELWNTIIRSNLPGLISAVIVLLIGWLIALWLAGKAGRAADHCSRSREKIADEETDGILCNTGKIAYGITYWVIMIFTILCCMSILHQEYAAVPLREFITTIAGYLPNIAGALLLLLLARIVAGIARVIVRKAVLKAHDNSISEKSHLKAENTAKYSSEAVFYVVYLFFLPAILNALGIYGITEPLQEMFGVILIFLPRIVAAALILFIGLWAAKIVRKAVTGAVEMSKLDAFAEMCRFGNFSGSSLARLLGAIAWVLVAIPVIIASLTALNIAVLSVTVAGFLELLLDASAKIIGALLILFAAFIAARIADTGVRKISAAAQADKLLSKAGITSSKLTSYPLSAVLGKITFLCVIVLGILAACDIMHFEELAKIIRHFAVFGGNIILSVIVLTIGAVLANFAAGLFDNGKRFFAIAVKSCVMIFTIALALSNLEIGNGIVEIAFTILLGAFAAAFALAFGFGGREYAAQLLASWQQKFKGNRD